MSDSRPSADDADGADSGFVTLHGPLEDELPYLYWVCERLEAQAETAAGIRERIEGRGLLSFGALAAVVGFSISPECPTAYRAAACVIGAASLVWSGWFLVRLLRCAWVNVAEPLQYWAGDVRKAPPHARLASIAFHVRARLEERLDLNLRLRRELIRVQWGGIVGILLVCAAILAGGLSGGGQGTCKVGAGEVPHSGSQAGPASTPGGR